MFNMKSPYAAFHFAVITLSNAEKFRNFNLLFICVFPQRAKSFIMFHHNHPKTI